MVLMNLDIVLQLFSLMASNFLNTVNIMAQ